VRLVGAEIGGNLECTGGHFSNPEGDALSAERIKVGDHVFLSNGFRGKGRISLAVATVSGGLVWTGADSPRDVIMDLRGAHIGMLWDDPKSWPAKGKLLLDGLVYERIHADAPTKAQTRIEWLKLQPSFLPQPYEQLATVLRDAGHEEEARKILIQKQKDRATVLSRGGRILHRFFGLTVGYGYQPWNAFWIGLFIIGLGWGLFSFGSYKQVMCQTKLMERTVTAGDDNTSVSPDYPKFRPLIYSLDLFLPKINLRQADYWAPNANKEVELSISKRRMIPFTTCLIYYSYAHWLFGWLITPLFIWSVPWLIKRYAGRALGTGH